MSPFPEEHLDAEVGYFAGQPGQTLQNGRWTIIRKLGWGPRSSTWLVVDSEDSDNIEALKIFTVAASGSASKELKIFQGPLEGQLDGLPVLRGHFYEQSSKGKHLCFVLHVLGSSVQALRLSNAQGACLPVHTVKKIVADILEPLSTIHKLKIIHGALTEDNLLFLSEQQASDIREIINASPSVKADEVKSDDGSVYNVVKSQPIGHDFQWNESRQGIANASIYLSNFGHAHLTHESHISLDTIVPEALNGEPIGVKSDIWTLGLTAYLLLTGTPLLSNSPSLSEIEEKTSKLSDHLTSSNKVSPKDIAPTILFLQACLNLDADARPSAYDLIGHEWVAEGMACSCGYCEAD